MQRLRRRSSKRVTTRDTLPSELGSDNTAALEEIAARLGSLESAVAYMINDEGDDEEGTDDERHFTKGEESVSQQMASQMVEDELPSSPPSPSEINQKNLEAYSNSYATGSISVAKRSSTTPKQLDPGRVSGAQGGKSMTSDGSMRTGVYRQGDQTKTLIGPRRRTTTSRE
jgi:hypothetical protein